MKDIYIFSKSANLLCVIENSTGKYYVCNGAWYGIREGDNFTVEQYPDIVLTITDWKEFEYSKCPKGYYKEYGKGINMEIIEEDIF